MTKTKVKINLRYKLDNNICSIFESIEGDEANKIHLSLIVCMYFEKFVRFFQNVG